MRKKKSTDNRLNKLFEEFRQEGTPAESKSEPRKRALNDKSRTDSIASLETREKNKYARSIEVMKSPVHVSESAMAFAFQSGQNHWSTLQIVDEKTLRTWTPDEQLLVKQVADQLSLALENARLFQETQLRATELSVLNEMGNELSGNLGASAIAEVVYKYTSQLMDTKNFYIALYDENKQEKSYPIAFEEGLRLNLSPSKVSGKGFTDYIIRNKKAVFAPDDVLGHMQRLGIEFVPLSDDETPSQCWLGVPMMLGDRVLGVVSVQSVDTPHLYNEHNQDILATIASQAAIAIESARLFQETQQSEAELRALFSAMNDVIIIYDRDGRYVRIAPTNPSLLVKPADEMVGKNIREILPRALHSQFMSIIYQALESGEIVKTEYPLEIRGKQYWFDANVSGLNEDQVFWVARDITDRKNAEETLKRRSDYLSATAEIGRLVTSSLDLSTIFARTVNLVRERFGFYHAAIFITEETGFHSVLREATGAAGEKMKANKHTLTVGSRSIVGTVTSTGDPLVVNDTETSTIHHPNPLLPETRAELAIPLRISSRIIGALDIQSTEKNAFTQDDVFVLQSLADQIAVAIDNARSFELSQQAIMEMREVDRLKSQFLANMSHELRTPLNSIIGFSRVILKGIDGPISELQHQDLTAIYNSGQHLLGLINDILDLSRIEAGKMELNFEEVHLSDLASSVMSTMKGLVKEKPIELRQLIPADLPVVRGDTMRVRQILLNLMSNAAKFTDQGSITVEARVQRGQTGRPEVLVSVVDTGPGISAEDQKKLFQAFSQVDGSPTRKTGGSGLGLSICANLVQMQGGLIGVDSEVGKGSTFYFTLPLYHQPEEDIPQGKKVVLAIDDDPQVIGLYERYLTPQGYYVVPLTDPSKSKERAKQLRPYAITLDIMMPGVDGWTVLTDLKSDPETREVPVIICSIIEQTDKGFSLGAADYLVKPILEEDLVGALNHLNGDGSIREVLVIDDDLNSLRLIEKILNDDGHYRPILVESGQQAWEAITSNPPDAIILDLFMPGMNGFAILEKLRETPSLRDIPVLVVSAGGLSPEQQKQLSDFGQRLITKGSLKEDELIETIEHALRRIGT